jgi:hypothetical protein
MLSSLVRPGASSPVLGKRIQIDQHRLGSGPYCPHHFSPDMSTAAGKINAMGSVLSTNKIPSIAMNQLIWNSPGGENVVQLAALAYPVMLTFSRSRLWRRRRRPMCRCKVKDAEVVPWQMFLRGNSGTTQRRHDQKQKQAIPSNFSLTPGYRCPPGSFVISVRQGRHVPSLSFAPCKGMSGP